MAIELEKIKPWDGQSGTGADNRGVIDRNFEKVETELGAINTHVNTKFDDVEDEIVQLAGEFKLNSAFNRVGYVNTAGSVIENSESSIEFSNTGFVRYFGGDIIVSGYNTSTVSLIFFYDKYLQPISNYEADTGVNNDIVILNSDVPDNTYFVIATAKNSNNNAKLITNRRVVNYFSTLDDYINKILLMQELDDTISTPTFDSFGQPMSVIHRDASNRIIRSDTFTFSDTEIVEVRTFKDKSKTFTTELSTLKTIIL